MGGHHPSYASEVLRNVTLELDHVEQLRGIPCQARVGSSRFGRILLLTPAYPTDDISQNAMALLDEFDHITGVLAGACLELGLAFRWHFEDLGMLSRGAGIC